MRELNALSAVGIQTSQFLIAVCNYYIYICYLSYIIGFGDLGLWCIFFGIRFYLVFISILVKKVTYTVSCCRQVVTSSVGMGSQLHKRFPIFNPKIIYVKKFK